MDQYMERDLHIAANHHNHLVMAAAWKAMKFVCINGQLERKVSDLADIHYTRNLIKAYFRFWKCRLAVSLEIKRMDFMASIQCNKQKLRLFFFAWNARKTAMQTKMELNDTALLHWAKSLSKSALTHWLLKYHCQKQSEAHEVPYPDPVFKRG